MIACEEMILIMSANKDKRKLKKMRERQTMERRRQEQAERAAMEPPDMTPSEIDEEEQRLRAWHELTPEEKSTEKANIVFILLVGLGSALGGLLLSHFLGGRP